MPLPMVHLAITHALMDDLPKVYKKEDIYLGAIAPDAIHMRENFIRKFKYKTHLCYGREGDVVDRLLELDNAPMDGFKLGYGIHVITDIVWLYEIFYPFKDALGDVSTKERELIYYGENDQLDFELYHRYAWRASVFEAMTKAKIPQSFPLLSHEEIKGWRHHILNWYNDGESKHDIEIKHLSLDKIDAFMNEALIEIKRRLPQMMI